jgi:hypothetical protein
VLQQLRLFQSVNEHDIDLLVLEELNVSDSLAQRFIFRVREELIPVKTLSAWHSVVDTNLGELDHRSSISRAGLNSVT